MKKTAFQILAKHSFNSVLSPANFAYGVDCCLDKRKKETIAGRLVLSDSKLWNRRENEASQQTTTHRKNNKK